MCIWVHHSLAIVLAVGVLTGCVSISTDLQPVNPDVQPALVGEDCSPIVLGFGFGHNTVAQAQKDNLRGEGKFDGFGRVSTPITKIRVTRYVENTMVFFGTRCVEVVGEP
jgi:hypothetical protein